MFTEIEKVKEPPEESTVDLSGLVPQKLKIGQANSANIMYVLILGANLFVFLFLLFVQINVFQRERDFMYRKSLANKQTLSELRIMYNKEYYRSTEHYDNVIVTLCLLSLTMLLFSGVKLSISMGNKKFVTQYNKAIIDQDRNVIVSNKSFDYLVNLNLRYLKEYYELVEVHTNQSFYIASAVGLAGFILISAGVLIGLMGHGDAAKTSAYLSSIAGMLTSFISGIQFKNYADTVKQLKEYHDSLIEMQNVLLSFRLIETKVGDVDYKEMISKMIDYLIGKKIG